MPLLNAGDVAPDFSQPSHDGKTVKLGDLKGKTVVLWFYPKADTPGWTIQGNGLRERSKELAAKNAVVLGVSFDPVEDNRKFAEKFGFPFPLLSDTKRTLGIAYGAADDASAATAKRIAYVIGSDGRVKTVFAKATPKTFADDVLAVL